MLKRSLQTSLIAAAMLFAHGAIAQQTASAAPTATVDPSAPRDPALKPVFEQFGGKPGITNIINDAMDNLLADPRTRAYFVNADRVHIKAELVDQICTILDGPCTYTGKTMASVHRNLAINHAVFNAFVEDVQSAMTKNKVPFRAQNKLLATLAPMNNVIITK